MVNIEATRLANKPLSRDEARRIAANGEAAGAVAERSIAVSFSGWQKGTSELGLSFTTDSQKEVAWRMEFEALGEQSVLKNVNQGATYNESKRQTAFRWLSEQAQLRDRREATADWAWGVLFASMATALIAVMGVLMLMALH
jgi:hypothetical protein